MKYPTVIQAREEDCGAACLKMVCQYYRRNYSLNRVREAVGTGQEGTSLLGLRRGAEILGLKARSAKASPELVGQLNKITLPVIIHWQGNHFVVLYAQKKEKYIICDPAVGIRYLSRGELLENWDGLLLLLEPDEVRFSQLEEDQVKGLGRFLGRVVPYSGILIEAFFINLFLGLLSLASPLFLQILTDDVLVRGDTKILKGLAIAIIIMNLMSSGLGFIQSNLIIQFTQRLELGLVMEFGQKILRLPLNYYESRRSGEVVSRLQDIEEINQLVSEAVVSLPSQFFIAIISLILMLFYSWKLSILVLGIFIITTIATGIFWPILEQKIRSILVLDAENQGLLVETFKGALTLKITNAYPQFWEELQSRFGKVSKLVLNTSQIGIINSTSSSLIASVGSVFLLWLGSTLVIQKELSIGQLLAFYSLNNNFVDFLDSAIDFIDEFVRVKTSVQRLSEVIDYPEEEKIKINKPVGVISKVGNIQLSNLNFYHPGRAELFKDFSLDIQGGKVTSIIGRSGCGKSSIAKLLTGLYSPQSGNICLGIYNLNDLPLDCLREQVVLVPQDANFWSRSIIENFRLGFPTVTFEEIITACQITKADDFIKQLPNSYQTVLGEFGANLSGGQKQRLAVARAIVKNPPILILDESTAALDPISEAQMLDNLLAYRQGKTTILISHRPAVIERSEFIVYLENGQVKLQGSLADCKAHLGEHLNFFPSS